MYTDNLNSPQSEALVSVPIPPLVVLLAALEKEKGAALTEEEVLAAGTKAACMQMPVSLAKRMKEKRGYVDLDLTDLWSSWQQFRIEQHRS